jgi:hypothetical protein
MADKRGTVRGIGGSTVPGVVGEAETAPALYGESSNGPGVEAVGAEIGARVTLLTASPTYTQTIAEFKRETSVGPATSGIGGSIDVKVEEPGGDVSNASRWVVERGSGTVVVGLRTCKGSAAGTDIIKSTDDGTTINVELAAAKPVDVALATHSMANPPGWSRWAFTVADIVALGAVKSGEINLCTLKRGHVVHAVILNVRTAATVLSDLTLSIGVTATDYIDMLIASDAKSKAVYGNAAAELGGTLADGVPAVCLTDATVLKLQAVTTDGTNDLEDALALVFEVYVLISKIPSMTAAT